MAHHNLPGLLVAFEGADGVGKTTQAHLCADALNARGTAALFLYEPTRESEWGLRLRELMKSGRGTPLEEFELFKKDRAYDVETNILPALAAGKVVCIDRYYLSSMAYQGALGVAELSPERIRRENEAFAPEPDLLLYFDMPLEDALRRITANRGEALNTFEQADYQQRVRNVYAQSVISNFKNAAIIDASGTPEEVAQAVMVQVQKIMAERRA